MIYTYFSQMFWLRVACIDRRCSNYCWSQVHRRHLRQGLRLQSFNSLSSFQMIILLSISLASSQQMRSERDKLIQCYCADRALLLNYIKAVFYSCSWSVLNLSYSFLITSCLTLFQRLGYFTPQGFIVFWKTVKGFWIYTLQIMRGCMTLAAPFCTIQQFFYSLANSQSQLSSKNTCCCYSSVIFIYFNDLSLHIIKMLDVEAKRIVNKTVPSLQQGLRLIAYNSHRNHVPEHVPIERTINKLMKVNYNKQLVTDDFYSPIFQTENIKSRLLSVFSNENKRNVLKSKLSHICIVKSGRVAIIGYSSIHRGDINFADLNKNQCQKYFFNRLEGGLAGIQSFRNGLKVMIMDRRGKVVFMDTMQQEIKDTHQNSFNSQIQGARDFDFLLSQNKVAVGCQDKQISILDLVSRKPQKVMLGHGSQIYSVSRHPFYSVLLTSSMDQTVRLWDISSGSNFCSITPHKTGVSRAMWHPNGNHYLTFGKDSQIHIMDLRRKGVVQSATTFHQPKCMAISSEYFVIGDVNGGVQFFDNFGKVIDYSVRQQGNAVLSMSLNEMNNLLVLGRERRQLIEVYGQGLDGKQKINTFI